ncbi:MAG: discoidin domain-containing protein, partial [Oscillospiraceae bacterium]
MTSRWSSNKSDDAWMTVDLTKPEAINKVVLKWELKADNFIIQVSNDNQNWYTVNEEFRSKPNEGGYAVVNELEFAPVTARYVRLQVVKRALALDGTYKGCGLYEFEVYRSAETPLAVTGAPENGSTRGAVTLTAEKEAVWTVNGVEVEKA